MYNENGAIKRMVTVNHSNDVRNNENLKK